MKRECRRERCKITCTPAFASLNKFSHKEKRPVNLCGTFPRWNVKFTEVCYIDSMDGLTRTYKQIRTPNNDAVWDGFECFVLWGHSRNNLHWVDSPELDLHHEDIDQLSFDWLIDWLAPFLLVMTSNDVIGPPSRIRRLIQNQARTLMAFKQLWISEIWWETLENREFFQKGWFVYLDIHEICGCQT